MRKAKIDEILYADEAATIEEQSTRVRDKFWKKFRKTTARLPFAEDVVAAYYCALDPETPSRVRGVLLAALAYFILPLDSIPDFLMGFGLTDDIAVLTAAITAIQGNIRESHREAARRKLKS